jgi:negative regulator of replication initiation
MKKIEIANSTYGALWSHAIEADMTEDDILRRLLSLPAISSNLALGGTISHSGFHDARFNVTFQEGFRIYRNYRGEAHEAIASKGRWQLDADEFYDSLNKLNGAIGAATENAWATWYFDRDGQKTSIDELRNPATIRRR